MATLEQIQKGRIIISRVENLMERNLARGEKRDLLMDTTDWDYPTVCEVVERIERQDGI